MRFLYDLSLLTYQAIINLLSPFKQKAKQWSEGRRDIFARLEAAFKGNDKEVAWFHCASLGEFEQGRPIIELFRERYPDYIILITFFSPSGYEVRKNYDGADHIFYLPIDTKRNAKRFIEIVRPKVAVFVKYEFWKNYLTELKNKGVKSYVISAIFRPNQLFFRSYGKSYAKVLDNFDHIFVQNSKSKELLQRVGIEKVTVCGDTRFDRVYSIAKQSQPLEVFEKFAASRQVFITGSSWESDDKITLKLIEKFGDIKFIIAPHELPEAKISTLYNDILALGKKVVRYSKISDIDAAASSDVIIIDVIGILSKVYRNCSYGYIGGGFGVGIHNTLEAATFGLPIIFGPNYKRFAEALSLVEIGVATPINNENEAIEWLKQLLENRDKKETINRRALEYVESNIGACKKIIEHPLIYGTSKINY